MTYSPTGDAREPQERTQPGRKAIPPEQRIVRVQLYVSPAIRDWLTSLRQHPGESLGAALTRYVEEHQTAE